MPKRSIHKPPQTNHPTPNHPRIVYKPTISKLNIQSCTYIYIYIEQSCSINLPLRRILFLYLFGACHFSKYCHHLFLASFCVFNESNYFPLITSFLKPVLLVKSREIPLNANENEISAKSHSQSHYKSNLHCQSTFCCTPMIIFWNLDPEKSNPITTPSLNPIRFPLDSPLHPMINGSIPFQIPIPNPHEIPMKSPWNPHEIWHFRAKTSVGFRRPGPPRRSWRCAPSSCATSWSSRPWRLRRHRNRHGLTRSCNGWGGVGKCWVNDGKMGKFASYMVNTYD